MIGGTIKYYYEIQISNSGQSLAVLHYFDKCLADFDWVSIDDNKKKSK